MPSPRRLAALGAGLLLASTLAACGSDHSGSTSGGPQSPTSAATATGRAADVAFAQLMIPHHEQALDMARMAERQATSPDVKRLAAQIEAAQDPEIRTMKGWLSTWGAPEQMPGATSTDGGMDHSGHDMGGMTSEGMMTAEDMAALESASGEAFDRTWLEMMIQHHEGAVVMAEQVLRTTSDAEVRTLAEAVVTGQRAEIAEMQKLLDA
jgi:uncharacterized protein (DUF305 family)